MGCSKVERIGTDEVSLGLEDQSTVCLILAIVCEVQFGFFLLELHLTIIGDTNVPVKSRWSFENERQIEQLEKLATGLLQMYWDLLPEEPSYEGRSDHQMDR